VCRGPRCVDNMKQKSEVRRPRVQAESRVGLGHAKLGKSRLSHEHELFLLRSTSFFLTTTNKDDDINHMQPNKTLRTISKSWYATLRSQFSHDAMTQFILSVDSV
jgi:hypothetical protein